MFFRAGAHGLCMAEVSKRHIGNVQGPEDPQVDSLAGQLATLVFDYTTHLGLEEARSLLQRALEVSMVSVTLLCCLVLVTSPKRPE